MLAVLRDVRKKVVIGFVGGSDLVKITEQLQVPGIDGAFSGVFHPTYQDLTMHLHPCSALGVGLWLRGERADGVQAGQAARVAVLHQLARRGEVQATREFHSSLCRRHGHPYQTVTSFQVRTSSGTSLTPLL